MIINYYQLYYHQWFINSEIIDYYPISPIMILFQFVELYVLQFVEIASQTS